MGFQMENLYLQDCTVHLLSCLYVMLYAAIRGFTSQFRADDLYLAGLKAPYLVSLAGFALALALLLRFRLYQKRHHS